MTTRAHPLNRLLKPLGLTLGRLKPRPKAPAEFQARYEKDLASLEQDPRGWQILRDPWYEVGDHPFDYQAHESEFAAKHLARTAPRNVLDIGSYRLFVLGMLSSYAVTTIDVRPRESNLKNETVVTCDAKQLTLPDASFDAVVSLCAVEHFGLGRYGDSFDREADEKGIREMLRVLRPGGRLLLTTTLTRGEKAIAFNAHRIYTRDHIRGWAKGMEIEEEQYYSFSLKRYCSHDEITAEPGLLDIYMGCWRKG